MPRSQTARRRWIVAIRRIITVVLWGSSVVASATGLEPAAAVNGEVIQGWELERELAVQISMGSYHRRISDERRTELRCESLHGIVLKELKLQWARENPVEVDPAVEQAAWQEVRNRFSSDEQYREALEIKGIADEAFRRAFHRDAVARAVDEFVIARVDQPSEQQVEVFFELHRGDYMSPEARHVVHVLFYVPPSASSEEWQAAEDRAGEIVVQAAAGDVSLLELSKRDLEDVPPRFRDQVGDIGFVHRGSLQSAIDEAVFATEVGSLTDPVRTIYGIHILQVIDIRQPVQLELAEVRAAVGARIEREQVQRNLAAFERELLDNASIEVSECAGSF